MLDRADALQRTADLLALPVHVTEKYHHPCADNEALRWCEKAPLRTFLPRTSVCHPLARLHQVQHPPLQPRWVEWYHSKAAVQWYPSPTTKKLTCVMRFGPDCEALGETDTDALNAHPGLKQATAALIEQTLRHLGEYRLGLGPGVDLAKKIERYATNAVAQMARIPTVVDAWAHTRTNPTMPEHRVYGCNCYRRGHPAAA